MDTCKIGPGLYQYTSIDDCTRYRVLRIYERRTAANTLDFNDAVTDEIPFPIQRKQTERGRERFLRTKFQMGILENAALTIVRVIDSLLTNWIILQKKARLGHEFHNSSYMSLLIIASTFAFAVVDNPSALGCIIPLVSSEKNKSKSPSHVRCVRLIISTESTGI